MKHIKKFESYANIINKSQMNNNIMIDCEPYDISQFNQEKYGVYIKNDNKYYYIGDLRKFSNKDEYLSYLDIERYIIKEPKGMLCKPDNLQMEVINIELEKNYLSPNLMDETISFREFLQEKGIL